MPRGGNMKGKVNNPRGINQWTKGGGAPTRTKSLKVGRSLANAKAKRPGEGVNKLTASGRMKGMAAGGSRNPTTGLSPQAKAMNARSKRQGYGRRVEPTVLPKAARQAILGMASTRWNRQGHGEIHTRTESSYIHKRSVGTPEQRTNLAKAKLDFRAARRGKSSGRVGSSGSYIMSAEKMTAAKNALRFPNAGNSSRGMGSSNAIQAARVQAASRNARNFGTDPSWYGF